MKAICALLGLVLAVHFQAVIAADPAASAKLKLPADLVAVADAAYAPLDKLAEGSKEAQEAQKAAVAKLGLPLEIKTAKTGIALRLIPAGSFTMGSPAREAERSNNETPHQVTLTKAYYCGKYAVTQGQWEAVMGSNPSQFKDAGKDAPVEQVSWEDGQEFLKKLCALEGVPAGTYRLLTEAEWEYACRAGTSTATYGTLGGIAWYTDNSQSKTHAVGQKLPNAYGLYDMIGNVWQWCGDWYGDYPTGAVTDPTGSGAGSFRVSRGGGWDYFGRDCRSAGRDLGAPGGRGSLLGLRVCRLPPGQ